MHYLKLVVSTEGICKMEIREIQIADSKYFSELTKIRDAGTPFLYFEENERKTTLNQNTESIKSGIIKGYISLIDKIDNKLITYVI